MVWHGRIYVAVQNGLARTDPIDCPDPARRKKVIEDHDLTILCSGSHAQNIYTDGSGLDHRVGAPLLLPPRINMKGSRL